MQPVALFGQHEYQEPPEGENDLTFPFLAKVNGAGDVLKAMDDEHHSMAAALAETRAAMTELASTDPAADGKTARDSVARTQAVVDQRFTPPTG